MWTIKLRLSYNKAVYVLSLFPRIFIFESNAYCMMISNFYQFKSKLTFVHIGNCEGLIEHIQVSIML